MPFLSDPSFLIQGDKPTTNELRTARGQAQLVGHSLRQFESVIEYRFSTKFAHDTVEEFRKALADDDGGADYPEERFWD